MIRNCVPVAAVAVVLSERVGLVPADGETVGHMFRLPVLKCQFHDIARRQVITPHVTCPNDACIRLVRDFIPSLNLRVRRAILLRQGQNVF